MSLVSAADLSIDLTWQKSAAIFSPAEAPFSEGGLFTSHFCLSRSKLANQNVDLSPEGWRQALCAVLGTSNNETVLLIGLSACMTAAAFIAELIGPVAF